MLQYIKKHFERPNNGLMQVTITQALVFVAFRFMQIIHKLTGFISFEKICYYTYLSSDDLYAKPWTLVTYFFVHQHFGALLFNLQCLYSFGRVTVHFLGSKKFLTIYLLGGIVGGITFVLSYNFLPYFIKIKEEALQNTLSINLIGSSAALYAVITGIATFAPNFALSFFPFFSVKIKHITLVFLIWPIWNLSYGDGGEGINMARLGGALWGYVYIQYLLLHNNKKWRVWLNQLHASLKQSQNIFVKNVKKPEDNVPTTKKTTYSNISKEEVEAILDKIALYGYKKLTQEEKRKLFDAGEG